MRIKIILFHIINFHLVKIYFHLTHLEKYKNELGMKDTLKLYVTVHNFLLEQHKGNGLI
jgi:hypothetical protein